MYSVISSFHRSRDALQSLEGHKPPSIASHSTHRIYGGSCKYSIPSKSSLLSRLSISPTPSYRIHSSEVFTSLSSNIKAGETVLRRTKILTILDKHRARTKSQIAIDTIWRRANELLTEDNFGAVVEESLEAIGKIDPKLAQIYAEFLSAKSLAEVQEWVKEFIDDSSYLFTNMVVHSESGDRGALIVSYKPKEAEKDHVIKWVDRLEVDSTQVYQIFSGALQHVFSVPRFATTDLKRKCFTPISAAPVAISDTDLASIKKIHKRLLLGNRSSFTIEEPKITLNCEAIMFSEKIKGEGLYDFINSRYMEMNSSQKKALFQKFGNLIMLDLILHNDDRIQIVHFDEDTATYELALASSGLSTTETNLNNLMIGSDPQYTVYAIDNGLTWDDSPKTVAAYNKFLNQLLKTDGWEELICDASCEALSNTLSDSGSSTPSPPSESEALFLSDLEYIGKEHLTIGIIECAQNAKRGFHNPKFRALAEGSPDLVSAIFSRAVLFI